jgi:hypothetical protein
MQNQQALPRWLYVLTPCTITATFFVFAILDSYADLDATEGWSFPGIMYIMPPLAGVILLDVILRLVLKYRFGLLWLIESIAVLLVFLLLAYLSGKI